MTLFTEAEFDAWVTPERFRAAFKRAEEMTHEEEQFFRDNLGLGLVANREDQ